MKPNFKFFILIIAVIAASCKNEPKQDEKANKTETQQRDRENQPSTYAELSVRKGGEWADREYKGGEFVNVSNLEVPAAHTDHSYFIRYEGPGWENAQIAYRLYLDWRNAIDVFGKKSDTLVLPDVGQDGFDSYHEEADWGMDILKAGKGLGIGGFGRFMNDSVAHFRKVESTYAEISNAEGSSEVRIDYSGWKTGDKTVDLSATLTIFPEDRFTKAALNPSEALEGLCTGIVKADGIKLIQSENQGGKWGYIATYGAQSLAGDEDQLGMAIFYKTEEVAEVKVGPHDHLVIFREQKDPVTYYFLAAWEQEPGGITSREEFEADLSEKLTKLEQAGKLE